MHKGFLGILAATTLAVGTVHADDLLGGKGKGKGGGGSQSGGSSGGSSSGGSRGGGSSQSGGSGSSRGGGSSQSGGSGTSRGGGTSNSGGGIGSSRGGGALGGGSSSGGSRSGGSTSRGGSSNEGGGFARGGDEFLGRRTGSSRSGSVDYGESNNNLRGNSNDPIRIGDRPVVIGGRGNGNWGDDRIQRVDNGNYRRGYYNYNRNWCDTNFWYPHYSFVYIPDRSVPSPFYYYSNLPAYINTVRIDWGWGSINFYETCRTNYTWIGNRSSNWDNNFGWDDGFNSTRGSDLDYAIADIVDSFRYQSLRSMSHMIPTRDYVNIEMSGDVRYRLRGDDFYDLMNDLVGGTYTSNYRIGAVRTGRGEALVEAEHEYRDAWNRRQVSRHIYGLKEYRGRYVIEYFAVR